MIARPYSPWKRLLCVWGVALAVVTFGGAAMAAFAENPPPPAGGAGGEEDQAERIHKAAQAAINRIAPTNKGQRQFFMYLEPETEDDDYDCETVYAYFVLRDLNQ